VNLVGHVDRYVAVPLNQDITPRIGYRLGVEPLTFQFEPYGGVDAYKVECVFFGRAATRAAINLGFDEFFNGGLAIAFDESEVATRRSALADELKWLCANDQIVRPKG